jgi:hypothetical protein
VTRKLVVISLVHGNALEKVPKRVFIFREFFLELWALPRSDRMRRLTSSRLVLSQPHADDSGLVRVPDPLPEDETVDEPASNHSMGGYLRVRVLSARRELGTTAERKIDAAGVKVVLGGSMAELAFGVGSEVAFRFEHASELFACKLLEVVLWDGGTELGSGKLQGKEFLEPLRQGKKPVSAIRIDDGFGGWARQVTLSCEWEADARPELPPPPPSRTHRPEHKPTASATATATPTHALERASSMLRSLSFPTGVRPTRDRGGTLRVHIHRVVGLKARVQRGLTRANLPLPRSQTVARELAVVEEDVVAKGELDRGAVATGGGEITLIDGLGEVQSVDGEGRDTGAASAAPAAPAPALEQAPDAEDAARDESEGGHSDDTKDDTSSLLLPKKAARKLPAGWRQFHDKYGRPYFVSPSNVASWERPTDPDDVEAKGPAADAPILDGRGPSVSA